MTDHKDWLMELVESVEGFLKQEWVTNTPDTQIQVFHLSASSLDVQIRHGDVTRSFAIIFQ